MSADHQGPDAPKPDAGQANATNPAGVQGEAGPFALRQVTLPGIGSLPHASASGSTLRVEGTNVVRVPFGVRMARRERPARPDHWATLVIPFQAGGSTPPPPQAA